MKTIAQCVLASDSKRLVAWLEADRIKPGFSVTLKNSEDPMRWWTILSMSQPMDSRLVRTEHDSKAIHEKDFHGTFRGLGL